MGRTHDELEEYKTKAMNLLGTYYPATSSAYYTWKNGDITGWYSPRHEFHKTDGIKSKYTVSISTKVNEWDFLQINGVEGSEDIKEKELNDLFN